MNKDAELLQQLVKILSNHCGETGENEGAVQTLNRIIEDAEKLKGFENIQHAFQVVKRLEKRIEALEEISQYDFAKGRVDSVLDMQIDDLQKLLEGEGWTDKHTKIAKESDEKFKTHTKDQEVDI